MDFQLVSDYSPTGDQPQAIDALCSGLDAGMHMQTLLGVTGSGKTFTMANVIARVNRPTLVLAHNKTLAAQLCTELREFFPHNAVEYFVSYYDYYQPEAYVPGKDMYIEKDALVNDEIDRLRHSATSALMERRDVIVVSSVSCIYSLGSPEEYKAQLISLRPAMRLSREDLIAKLVDIQYKRNDMDFRRDTFRVRGDTVEIFPANAASRAIRAEFFGDEVDRVSEFDPVTGHTLRDLNYTMIFPANHYILSPESREAAYQRIEEEMNERAAWFHTEGKLVEEQRITERTRYDLEMLREVGYCSGIENYSAVFSGRAPGEPPFTLFDFFPEDFMLFVDESHATLPQVRGMSGGDRARKENLVDYGFRLPSAFENRPLRFDEFEARMPQTICLSATPGDYERMHSSQIVEQLIRPTGLLDPVVEVRPVETQVDDLLGEIRARVDRGERVLVTTLTKKMAEDLTEYLETQAIRVKYIHHNVETMERMELLRDLRAGAYDVLVGINLLREGIDLPEVTLVAVLDADKEGFLRSETSLIQTIGRAARNVGGTVILYADVMTASIKAAVSETERRRKVQQAYNDAHGITPQTIRKSIRELISIGASDENRKKLEKRRERAGSGRGTAPTPANTADLIAYLTEEMKEAAKELRFEEAAYLRDKIRELQGGDKKDKK